MQFPRYLEKKKIFSREAFCRVTLNYSKSKFLVLNKNLKFENCEAGKEDMRNK